MINIKTLFYRWWYSRHQVPSHFTKEEAVKIASKYHLENEVLTAMKHGCSPDEALQEWDLYKFDEV